MASCQSGPDSRPTDSDQHRWRHPIPNSRLIASAASWPAKSIFFTTLIRPCERAIYFLLFSLLKNEAEAEDAAQETAIKVYLNLHLFRGDSQFRTWVLSIARNEGLGRLRKIGTRREDSLDAGTDEQTGDYTPAILTSWREIPAEALERKELGAILRKAIEGSAGDLP